MEGKELLCDTLEINIFFEERRFNYKIDSLKGELISVLRYKEHCYSGALHSSYRFYCCYFDLKNVRFLYYDDFFVKKTHQITRFHQSDNYIKYSML